MNWLNFLKPKRGTGALISPKDPRDVPVSAVTKAVSVPGKYFTDISFIPVFDQGSLGSCTGHAHASVIQYFEKIEGINSLISPRAIYGLAKKYDGLNAEGSYPRIVAANSKTYGNGTEAYNPNYNYLSHSEYININYQEVDFKPHRTQGYVWINPNEQALKEALIQFKLIEITLPVGDWNKLPVKPGNVSYHRIVLYGYDGSRFFFRNSWGNWGDGGNGYFDFKDFDGKIYDALVYTDIPNQILEEYKKKWPYKYFKPNEVQGLKNELVAKLDSARGMAQVPFVITSGLRTKDSNTEVGGVENSAHLSGLAADIRCVDSSARFKMIKALLMAGFNRVGVYKAHLHVDIDSNKPQEVCWYS